MIGTAFLVFNSASHWKPASQLCSQVHRQGGCRRADCSWPGFHGYLRWQEGLHLCFVLSLRHFAATLVPPDTIICHWLHCAHTTGYGLTPNTLTASKADVKWVERALPRVPEIDTLSVVQECLVDIARDRSNSEQENPLDHFLQCQKTNTENPFEKINGASCNKVKMSVYL